MLNRVLAVIADLKIFIIVCIVMIIVMGAFLLIFCRKFSFDGKNVKVVGFFYRMELWDSLALAVSLAKVCLFLSLFITVGDVDNVHISIYVLLHLIYMAHRFELRGLLGNIFNGIATCAVMTIMGMLYNYLREVMFDLRIQVIIILMMIIIFGYATSDLFCCCRRIIMIPQVKENKDE